MPALLGQWRVAGTLVLGSHWRSHRIQVFPEAHEGSVLRKVSELVKGAGVSEVTVQVINSAGELGLVFC